MNKTVKRVLIIVLVLLIIGIITGIIIARNATKNLDLLGKMEIEEINITLMEDGTYYGEYKVFPVSAKVEVVVRNGLLAEVNLLEHNHGKGEKAEIIPQKVMDSQSLKVDAITGATYSSKVILKAIENALTK